MAPVAASGGLLVLLLLGACGRPAAAPEPVVLPTIPGSSAPVTSIPAVVEISVRAVPTSAPPPRPATVAATTEPPPPPPPPAQVQPQPAPPPVVTTTTPPRYDEVAIEGFPCDEEGATAVDPTGRDLVCERGRRNRLSWDRA